MKTLLLIPVLVGILGCATLTANNQTFTNDDGAIQGYDPVAYFVEGRPVKGKAELTQRHKGATWYFANEQNRQAFKGDKDLTHPLIETLPPLILLRSGEGHEDAWVKRMGDLMDEELIKGDPGTEIMVDRLCELFLIQVLRKISASDDHSFAFVQALEDRVIGRALELIHSHPEKGWNIENMASATGLSRSAFAKRFHHLTGMPPKAYLTMWRMHRVKALLRNPYNLLGQIATEVGYSSDVALIRAFQRFFGKSPKQMRLEINPSSA